MPPVFSKVLKRIIYNKIRNHCTINNLLFPKKSGFQANHLIHHAILSLVNDVTKPFQISELSLGISVGLSKAFNTAKHNILLTKLHNFGIKENCLKLLKSYLANINQCIFFHQKTALQRILYCVQQRSIFDPLLFLIYVSDLCIVSSLLTPVIFSNDSNLFFFGSNY